MVYLFLVLGLGLFVISLKFLGVVPRVTLVVANLQDATSVMKSSDLSEAEKEVKIQRAAVAMFRSLFSIALRSATTFAAPVVFVAAGSLAGLYTYEEAVQAAINWEFIVGSTVVMIGAFIVIK